MKAVIQCAKSKQPNAGHLKDATGRKVTFFAHPEKSVNQHSGLLLYHPDARIGKDSGTWRDLLRQYNLQPTNPDNLCRAGDLYKPPIYRALVQRYGRENVFILSAGWGLVRSDYLLPCYDITFSSQAEPWARRGPQDPFDDFNQMSQRDLVPGEAIYFFGGKSYLPLYYALTQSLAARKVIYYAQANLEPRGDYEYIHYPPSLNWHYACARDFMDAKVAR